MSDSATMFERFKRLFRSEKAWPTETRPSETVAPKVVPPKRGQVAPQEPPTSRKGRRGPSGSGPAPVGGAGTDAAGGQVRVSLRSIVLKLPDVLKAKVRQPPTGGVQIAIPLDQVLPQLQQGSVRITFGDLRKASPPGIFSDAADRDHTPVELPLQEILPQLRPDQLPRRAAQRKIVVPDDVTPIFGAKGHQESQARISNEKGPTKPTPVQKAPPTRLGAAPPPAPIPIRGSGLPPAPTQRPAPPPPAPLPIKPSIPLPATDSLKQGTPLPGARPPISPIRPPSPTKLPGAPPASATPATGTVNVPLANITSGWPQAIRQAIAGLNAPDAQLVLPAAEVEAGLKKGRVAFTWKNLKPLIRPPLRSGLPPALDNTEIELPLPEIAPLYFAQRAPTAPRKKVAINTEIPDVFTGKGAQSEPVAAEPPPTEPKAPPTAPAPAPIPMPTAPPTAPVIPVTQPAPAPVAPPSPTPAPVAKPEPVAPKVSPADAGSIGELFGQPGRTNWSPADVVKKTSEIGGVSGALIVMQDGLMVASEIPSGLNAEAIAAFLPQMFSRMMQYCEELKFGESNSMTLIINEVPLKIFRLGGIYLGVLGKAKETLPDAKLNVVAEHLAPKK